MSPDELEMFQSLIKNTLKTLGLFSIEQYEELVESDRQSISQFDALAPMLDPTAYRAALQSGELEHQKAQARILEHILEIRKEMQIMHDISMKIKASE